MPSKKKLGEILIESGAASEDDVKRALGQQRAFGSGRKLGDVMVSLKIITPTALARALAQQADLPFVELPEIPERVSALVPLEFQAEHRVIPFRLESEGRSERLHVAVDDPSRLDEVDELRFQLRKAVRVHVAASDDIDNTLAVLRGEKEEVIEALAIDEDSEEELQVDRTGEVAVVGNWFGGPNADPAKALAIDNWDLPAGPSPAAAPAPKPAAPQAATPPPVPVEPKPAAPAARSAQADLDELFGDGQPGAPAPAAPEPKPAAPIQVVSFNRSSPPPQPAEAAPAPAPGAPPAAAEAVASAAPVTPSVPAPNAAQAPQPPPAELSRPKLEISEQDLLILDELDRMAQGSEPALDSEKVRPARMVASLIRLLIRKGVIHELEFLEELARK